MTTYMTIRELQKMAIEKKIKYYSSLSKIELVKALNLDEKLICKPKEVLITNVDTQVVTKYKNMHQCSKALGKYPGSIRHHLIYENEFVDNDGNKVRVSYAT